jgi:hypothetical protein
MASMAAIARRMASRISSGGTGGPHPTTARGSRMLGGQQRVRQECRHPGGGIGVDFSVGGAWTEHGHRDLRVWRRRRGSCVESLTLYTQRRRCDLAFVSATRHVLGGMPPSS